MFEHFKSLKTSISYAIYQENSPKIVVYSYQNKNMFEHFNLANILLNNKTKILYKKNHQGRGVTPRQIHNKMKTILQYSIKYIEDAKKTVCTYSKIQIYFNISIWPIFRHHTNKLSLNVESNSNGFFLISIKY